MPKITVLDKHVAELIAAGEVVERPSSVIKELLENSIDAKATSITVEIARGGISFIRITDNGCGISHEDVPTAFLRHATSKVKNASDLDNIASLGFRGEALASISAVARVELLTKQKEDELGTRIVINGGETEDYEDAGCPNGTTIVVRDIFYNIPARMKFLKKDVGEGNAVANIMDKIALSHPEISFRFIRDKKEVLYTPGDNKLSSAIYGVFGKDFLNSLMPVEYSYENIKISGYISKTTSVRPNRNMQNFFINGRFIKSKTAMFALEEGYKGSVMTGKFPACVLHIEMPCSLLDVNVHPAKLEVRFVNEKPVFSTIYHCVKTALLKNDEVKEFKFKEKPKVDIFAKPVEKMEQMPLVTSQVEVPKKQENIIIPKGIDFSDSEETKAKPLSFSSKIEDLMSLTPKIEETKGIYEPEIEIPVIERFSIPQKEIVEKVDTVSCVENTKDEFIEDEEIIQEKETYHRIVGEAFTTYIIIEYDKKLMLIDKHAAHERILYEKIRKDSRIYAQTLLAPVRVTLDKQSHLAIINNLDKLDKAGFVVEDFGSGAVIVRTAPLDLIGQDIVSSIIEISGYLAKNRNSIDTEHQEWIYSNVACRAAIKGGTASKEEEIIALAKQLAENPEIKHCPHGRPVFMIIKKSEIERQFGRT